MSPTGSVVKTTVRAVCGGILCLSVRARELTFYDKTNKKQSSYLFQHALHTNGAPSLQFLRVWHISFEKKGPLISCVPGLMFVFAQSHKLLAQKVTVPRRRAHARRPAAPAHGFVLPNEPGAVSLSSAPAVKITFEIIVRLQRATYLLMFQLSPSSLGPPPTLLLPTQPFSPETRLLNVAYPSLSALNGKCLYATQLGLVRFDDWN